jgi:hypothetical protein
MSSEDSLIYRHLTFISDIIQETLFFFPVADEQMTLLEKSEHIQQILDSIFFGLKVKFCFLR